MGQAAIAVIEGRDAERAALAQGLEDAAAGHGRLVLVAGEAGIGKTTLAKEAARVATERGFAALSARGWDGEGAPAYWPFIQIFRALARDVPGAKDLLGAERASLLGAIAPDLGTAKGTVSGAAQRFALFDAAASWLRDVSTARPLLVVLDDLHAVDPSSVSMLVFLARELRDARVAVVALYRDRDLVRAPEVEAEVAKLMREATLVSLARLERDAVLRIVEAAKGPVPPVIAELIVRAAEGVPLFVDEILRTMSTPGAAWLTGAPIPAGLRSVLRERIARLDEGAFRELEIASVAGRTFTTALVASVSKTEDAEAHFERGVAADVLERLGPGRWAFSHAMLRESLYRELPGARRAQLHAAILEALDAGRAASTPAERANHALRGAPVLGARPAIAIARAAADAALVVGAFEDAADLLRRALAVLDLAPADDALRAEVTSALARARGAGDGAPARPPEAPPATIRLAEEGELWVARLGGALARVKDSRGVRMLAMLVERAGEEVHALALSAAPGEDVVLGGDSGELLDREAIEAYRERVVDVEEELREAEGWNDAARVERARAELEILRAELSRAVGLGGRSRRAGADAERARVNCQRRIRDAIRRLAEQDATIGKHLLRAVRTGTFCAYLPAEA